MPRDYICHVAREQPVAVFFGVEQPETGASERFGAESETSGIESCRDDAKGGNREEDAFTHGGLPYALDVGLCLAVHAAIPSQIRWPSVRSGGSLGAGVNNMSFV